MSPSTMTEAQLSAFFQQGSPNGFFGTTEEVNELHSTHIDATTDIDAYFADLRLQTQTQTETTARDSDPVPAHLESMVPPDMTPAEFVAFCGYDPSGFKSLSQWNSGHGNIWCCVFEEITGRLQASVDAGRAVLAEISRGTAPRAGR
ncbi:hypothetical protein FPV67DRAFT_1451667 [Lyophyllum atratum]|nr:hypothetical protein FPV67DRAFT_1451667 [Lyophyllum atratum]